MNILDLSAFAVAPLLPSGDLGEDRFLVVDAAVEALAAQEADFDFHSQDKPKRCPRPSLRSPTTISSGAIRSIESSPFSESSPEQV